MFRSGERLRMFFLHSMRDDEDGHRAASPARLRPWLVWLTGSAAARPHVGGTLQR